MNRSLSLISVNYPTTLPSPDNYGAYKRAISNIPMINEDDEKFLITQWVKKKCKDSAKILVLSNMKLVLKVVANHKGYGLSNADLAQEGTVGLMRAVHKFNQSKGVRLSTYAFYWIEAQVRGFILKNLRLVSWGTSTLAKKLFFGYRKTVKSLTDVGDNVTVPRIEEISSSLGVSEKDAFLVQAFFLGKDMGLLEDTQENVRSDVVSFAPLALLSHDKNPQEQLEHEQEMNNLSLLSDKLIYLDDRQRKIINSRYFTEPAETLSQIASKLDISIERVRQIEKQSLSILKKVI